MRYSNTSKEKENGIVYTPTAMADYLAHEMIVHKHPQKDGIISILDPAVGEGELLISIISALSDISTAKIIAVGYETDSSVCLKTQSNLEKLFPNVTITIKNEDFLKAIEEKNAGE